MKCGAEVEAHMRIIIYRRNNASVRAKNNSFAHRFIALTAHSLVPIVEGGSRYIFFYSIQPWIFTRRLIKMAVYSNAEQKVSTSAPFCGWTDAVN